MKRIRNGLWLFAAVLGVGIFWATAFAAQSDETKSPPDVAVLLDRITKLEKRVAELESQAAQSRQVPLNLLFTPESNTSPALPRDPVPQNWNQHEFNGMKYYVLPVAPARTTR